MASQDFLFEYIEEVKEHVQELEECLLILEREGSNKRELSRIFRAAHSIKGASAYMGFEQLASLTHELESFMSTVQNNPRPLTPKAVSTLLACVDFISSAIAHLHDHGVDPPIPPQLLQSLGELHSAAAPGAPAPEGAPEAGMEERHAFTEDPVPELSIGEPGDRAASTLPDEQTRPSPVNSDTPSSLSSHEDIIEEEDEELFAIFLSSFQEHFTKLDELSQAMRGRRATDEEFQTLLELVGKLVSSSQYMDYERITTRLRNLETALGKERGTAPEDGTVLAGLIEDSGRVVEQLLPGLKLFRTAVDASTQPERHDTREVLQEEDQELLGIFVESVSQQLEELASLISSMGNRHVDENLLGKFRDILGKLASSSRYMGYDSVVETLREWDETLAGKYEESPLHSSGCVELYKRHTESLRQLLPGLVIEALRTSPTGQEQPSEAAVMMDISFDDLEDLPPASTKEAGPSSHPGEPVSSGVPKALQAEMSSSGIDTGPHGARRGRQAVPGDETTGASSLRVDAQKVDQLLNQVGELVVTRSEFIQASLSFREVLRELTVQGKLSKQEVRKLRALGFKLNESTLSLGRVANDLQNSIMRVRMLPISHLFQRFPRVVRDQALKLGKRVDLVVEGADTEIDKRVLEQMHDPLVQLLRNALAHAMEGPVERLKASKPEIGTIRLAAYHEGDYVVIEVEDDGRGIDTERLKATLLNQGRISPEQLERLSDKELLYAVFLPGISTQERVDGTAGRGVGLDVVKENLERMNGSIEVESQANEGTRFTIRIPLTVAIIRALMVLGAEQVFAVPLSSVSKILRYGSDVVHTIEGFHVITHRGKTLPLVHLGQLLGIPSQGSMDDHRFIVVVTTSFREVGLVVDGLIGEREIVIKSIDDSTYDYEGFSGATILGDGTVSLILDVSALLRLMKDLPRMDPTELDPMGFGEGPFTGRRSLS